MTLSDTFTQDDIDNDLLTFSFTDDASITSFNFTVTDGSTLLGPETFSINAVPINDPPVISANTGLLVNEGEAGSLITNIILNEGDPDDAGIGLTYTITSAPTFGILQLSSVGLGNGDTFTQADIDNNRVTYDHDDTENFTDGFDFSLMDGGEDGTVPVVGTFTINITPVNDNEQVLTTNNGTTVDEGSTGNTLTTAMLETTDGDNTAAELIYTVTGTPSHGTLYLNSTALSASDTFTQDDIDNGRISYDHDDSENFTDSFAFSVDDGAGVASTDTFAINVNPINDNDPVADDESFTVVEGGTATEADLDTGATLLDGDTDTDQPNDTLTINTTPASDPGHGSLTLNADGTFSYTHDGSENFSDSFTYELLDADGGVSDIGTVIITITPVNNTTIITSTAVTSATEDSTYSYTLNVSDIDVGDTLTLSAPTLPAWMTFDPVIGVLSGIPTNTEVGDHNVVLRVNDGTVDVDQSFTLTVNDTNDAPSITSTAITTATEDSAYSYTLTVSDVDTGDTLTLSASTLPAWLSFDAGTGVLSGTPSNAEVGDHNVVLRVNDGTVDVDQSFIITVSNTNDAPVLGDNIIRLEQGQTVVLTPSMLSASDIDNPNASLTFLMSGVSGGQFERLTNPGIAIDSFTQTELAAGQVVFVDDGDEVAPAYSVTVSDGNTSFGPKTAIVVFNPPTVIVTAVPDISATPESLPGLEHESLTAAASLPVLSEPNTEPLMTAETEVEEITEEETASNDGTTEVSPEEEAPAPSASPGAVTANDSNTSGNLAAGTNLQAILKNFAMRYTLPEFIATDDPALTDSVELTKLAAEIRSVLMSSDFNDELDRVRQDMADMTLVHRAMVGSGAALTTSLSVGYVAWLIRGGVLLSTMLSSLPAWQFVDPLPVLARTRSKSEDEDSDEDSLESIIEKQSGEINTKSEEPAPTGEADNREEKNERIIMIRLNTKARIAFGQVGLVASILLAASFIGLVPDQKSAVREGRAALAEALAANSSALLTQKDLRRLENDLQLVVERNEDLLSAGLRMESGRLVTSVDSHRELWQREVSEYSTDSQVKVPIWSGTTRWGYVELRFQSISDNSWLGLLQEPMTHLIAFIGLLSFIAFYFYLGKMLKHLDPSKAIPSRVKSALDNMAEGLLVLDTKEQIVLANRAFGFMLQKTPEELLGLRLSILPWTTPDGAAFLEDERPWRRALQTGEAQINQRIRLALPNSSHRTFMLNSSPVLGGGDNYAGILVSFDDVTQLEEQEIELLKSKEEAEAANLAKSAFLANMSYEIRTPMNAILGFADLLKRGFSHDAEESRRYLEIIHSSGKHLLELINDVLDLSKVESGHFEIECVSFNPYRTIQDVIQVLDIKAREKGITTGFRVEGNVPEIILSDPARLRQIVTNLVGNAIKFTDQGKVETIARAVAIDETIRFEFEVVDTGIGMKADTLDRIFSPFVQADSSVTRKFGGTGLGLSISRKFARALGGDIRVESQPGVGSRFMVNIETGVIEGVNWLPGEQALEAIKAAPVEMASYWVFPGARILVVDDGPENRELVKLVLEDHGLVIDEAGNGQIAVEMANATPYDVILMDVQMPIMDGFTATRALRDGNIRCPIVALTANAMKGFEQECMEAGYSDYISKPINIDHFLAKIAGILKAKPAKAPAKQRTAWDGQLLSPKPVKTTTHTRTGLGNRDARFAELGSRFLVRLASQLDEMDRAWTERNFEQLADLAHWVKGAGGTVGFDVFTSPALALEMAVQSHDEETIKTGLKQLRQLAADAGGKDNAISKTTRITIMESPVDAVTLNVPRPQQSPGEPIVSRLAGQNRMHGMIHAFVVRLEKETKEMQTALETGDLKTIAESARWLKGTGGTLGFDDFTEPAKTLEHHAKAGECEPIPELLDWIISLARAVQDPTTVADNSDNYPAECVSGRS